MDQHSSSNEHGNWTEWAGSRHYVTTPAAPWLDSTWHHIAFTADASKSIRLYVDGIQYGNTVTYTGTLDMPASPIYIGGDGANFFAGQIDDVQFTTGTPDATAIAGYAATLRPHAQTIWTDTNYATNGDALSSSCSAGARCADVTYGGTALAREGARYYVTHQARTTAGFWSSTTSDWFATGDAIAVSAPGSVSIATSTPGADVLATFSLTTTCTNGSGCALSMVAPSDTVSMTNAAGDTMPPITPTAPSAPANWTASSPLGLGYTIVSSSSGKDTSRWGAGTSFIAANLSQFKFIGANRTNALLQTMPQTTETTTVGVRLNAPLSTPVGTYNGTIQVIALDAP